MYLPVPKFKQLLYIYVHMYMLRLILSVAECMHLAALLPIPRIREVPLTELKNFEEIFYSSLTEKISKGVFLVATRDVCENHFCLLVQNYSCLVLPSEKGIRIMYVTYYIGVCIGIGINYNIIL